MQYPTLPSMTGILRRIAIIILALCALYILANSSEEQSWRGDYPPFGDYASAEAVRVAENVLSWQMDHGGWTKEVDFTQMAWQEGWPKSTQTARGVQLGSFDDGKTTAEIGLLAQVYSATGDPRIKDGVLRGLDFVFAAQYPSGGWPQTYPERGNYSDYVTFNDNAMVRILRLLSDVAAGEPPYTFVEGTYRERAAQAIDRGIDYILKAQIRDQGILTAWNQQHHPVTYEPMPGRPYEPAAITAYESVGIVEYLMSLPDPSPDVREAILSALEWLERSQLPSGEWARFYELGTQRPIFLGRDGIVRYSITEIDEERQTGYAWYGTWPRSLLQQVRLTGYMDELYAGLPERDVPRITVGGPLAQTRPVVHGIIPLAIEIKAHNLASIEQVVVQVGDTLIFQGPTPSARIALTFDTTQLPDGPHQLMIGLYTDQGIEHRRVVTFHTANGWTLTESFRPPEVSVWFGTVDYLQASERSEGWTYSTGTAAQFFGDGTRLIRAADTTEHLVWEAPQLRYAQLTLYTTDPMYANGLVMEVESKGTWRTVPYFTEIESGDTWSRITIQADIDPGASTTRFRVTLLNTIPATEVQLGHLELAGERAPNP